VDHAVYLIAAHNDDALAVMRCNYYNLRAMRPALNLHAVSAMFCPRATRRAMDVHLAMSRLELRTEFGESPCTK
jgi:hypothetical protein